MDYVRLSELDNQYPNISAYKEGAPGKTQILFGSYPEKNKIEFRVPPTLDNVKTLSDTNFRFILAIFKDYQDANPIYYTSEIYYNDLKLSLEEHNPYFLLASFSKQNIVPYVIDDSLKIFNTLSAPESKAFVDMKFNVLFKSGSAVEYDNLVRYIDWVVDTPSPLDDENYGVLHPEVISGWDVLNGNNASGKLIGGVSASFGISKGASKITDLSLINLENDLKFKQEKLNKINEEIAAINNELIKKSNYVLSVGKPASVQVYGKTYTTKIVIGVFLGLSKNKAIDELTSQLKARLSELTTQKNTTEGDVSAAKIVLDNTKASVNSAVNTITDLVGKIGSIPKIPNVPQIPKIPSLNDLGGAILEQGLNTALSLIPSIPKITLPKIPSFKLPPLKLFKKKEPKETKKEKNNKKKGLKGALNDINGAVAGAQSAAANAVSSAQGAVAAAQSAAMKATGNINAGMITNVTKVGGGTLTTKTITSAVLSKGETEASVLADIAKSMAEVAARTKQ
jgi:hypothetical protein